MSVGCKTSYRPKRRMNVVAHGLQVPAEILSRPTIHLPPGEPSHCNGSFQTSKPPPPPHPPPTAWLEAFMQTKGLLERIFSLTPNNNWTLELSPSKQQTGACDPHGLEERCYDGIVRFQLTYKMYFLVSDGQLQLGNKSSVPEAWPYVTGNQAASQAEKTLVKINEVCTIQENKDLCNYLFKANREDVQYDIRADIIRARHGHNTDGHNIFRYRRAPESSDEWTKVPRVPVPIGNGNREQTEHRIWKRDASGQTELCKVRSRDKEAKRRNTRSNVARWDSPNDRMSNAFGGYDIQSSSNAVKTLVLVVFRDGVCQAKHA
ncbi:hypothetical protein CBL_02725 [Carabus blaptoides fortunei]